jgi:outer membrane protein OmpA-like peptidoglycan-associated protein
MLAPPAKKAAVAVGPRRLPPDPEPAMPEKPVMLAHRPLSAEAFDQAAKQEQDRDGDGIPDALDKCPDQPETFNGYKDDDGCPDEVPKPVDFKDSKLIESTATQIKLKEKVYFRTGSDRLEVRSFPILRVLASFLKAKEEIEVVMIEGHTDNRGDREQNVDLSERRARRVKSFLVQEGVAVGRLRAKGYGPKKPIATNQTTKGRAENRRVQFLILQVRKLSSQEKLLPMRGTSTVGESSKKEGGR